MAFVPLLLAPVSAQDRNDTRGFVHVGSNGYAVQASAIRTNRLRDEELKQHGPPADDDLVLLNVTVKKDDSHVAADFDARAINLAQQVRQIDLKPTTADEPIRLEFQERLLPPVEDW